MLSGCVSSTLRNLIEYHLMPFSASVLTCISEIQFQSQSHSILIFKVCGCRFSGYRLRILPIFWRDSELCSSQTASCMGVDGFSLQRWHTLDPHAKHYSKVIKGSQRLSASRHNSLYQERGNVRAERGLALALEFNARVGGNRTHHQTTAMMKVILDTHVSLSPPCIGMKPGSGQILYNNRKTELQNW